MLDLSEHYEAFRNAVTSIFSETDLQLWFPDESTEEHLYRENAGRTGAMLHSIQLPETLAEFKAHSSRLHHKNRAFESLSCFAQGWPILGLIASRHFRAPVIPAYWQEAVNGQPPQPDQDELSMRSRERVPPLFWINYNAEWRKYCRSGQKPNDIPATPERVYSKKWR